MSKISSPLCSINIQYSILMRENRFTMVSSSITFTLQLGWSLFSAWIYNSVPINRAIHFILNYAVTTLQRVKSDANWGTNPWKMFHYCLNGRRVMCNVYVCVVWMMNVCATPFTEIYEFFSCFDIDLAAMVCMWNVFPVLRKSGKCNTFSICYIR